MMVKLINIVIEYEQLTYNRTQSEFTEKACVCFVM